MKVRISKWGNSLALRIPGQLARELGIREGSELNLDREGETLVLGMKKRPTLEELLERVTPDQVHREIDWGPPVGSEIW